MRSYDRHQTLVWAGGIAGLIPFLAAIFGIYWLGWAVSSFTLYSAIILAFLCGVVWKNSLDGLNNSPVGLALALGLPAGVWLLAFAAPGWQIAFAAAGFLAVYGWERYSAWSVYPPGYRVLRTTLTTLVVGAHLVLGWLL